ncbi:MAG: hypothetical protein ACRD68_09500 [Pyrinomonadaceae bacterium]
MGYLYLYRARVDWRKNGQQGQNIIPVFGFKAGWKVDWDSDKAQTLGDLKKYADMADGTRVLTICTLSLYAHRALFGKEIDYFSLAVYDMSKYPPVGEERKMLATITCRDMNPLNPISSRALPKYTEGYTREATHYTNVPLSFHDYGGSLTFQRT